MLALYFFGSQSHLCTSPSFCKPLKPFLLSVLGGGAGLGAPVKLPHGLAEDSNSNGEDRWEKHIAGSLCRGLSECRLESCK